MQLSSLFGRLGLAAIAVTLLSVANTARASLILEPTPDILVQLANSVYDATSDEYSFEGLAIQLLDENGVQTILGGVGTIEAIIDDSGTLLGGTVVVTGTIPSIGADTSPLLTGDLTELVGSNAAGGILEFTFTPTGGNAAVLSLYEGRLGGIIASNTGFNGSFATNFDNEAAQADIGVAIPEPTSLVSGLIGLGGLALVGYRRARRA